MEDNKTKVLIIGSGPAGFTAAIYASRANLHPILFEGDQPGGQLTQTTEIENFPGYPDGVQGMEMMNDLRNQAMRFGTIVKTRTIKHVDLSKRPFVCTDDRDVKYTANTVIICTGASAKYLGLPDEEKYNGLGVSACATCDGFFYRNKDVAVVGGGDTACEEALYLSTLCRKVYMIIRKDHMRASTVMQQRVRERDNIEVLYRCNTLGLFGENGVEGAKIIRDKGTENEETFDISIEGFFLAIGHSPNTSMFKGLIEMDESGYIKTREPSTETNIPGIFAAGDCADPTYRQAITSAGTGCRAALDAEHFLIDNDEL